MGNSVFQWFSLICILPMILIRIDNHIFPIKKSKIIEKSSKIFKFWLNYWSISYETCTIVIIYYLYVFLCIIHEIYDHTISPYQVKWSENPPKQSKMTQNDPKYQKHVKISFKKWVNNIKIDSNHGKLSFSMVFIDFYIQHVHISNFGNRCPTLL